MGSVNRAMMYTFFTGDCTLGRLYISWSMLYFFRYRKNLPRLISSIFYPILGNWIIALVSIGFLVSGNLETLPSAFPFAIHINKSTNHNHSKQEVDMSYPIKGVALRI